MGLLFVCLHPGGCISQSPGMDYEHICDGFLQSNAIEYNGRKIYLHQPELRMLTILVNSLTEFMAHMGQRYREWASSGSVFGLHDSAHVINRGL